MPASGGLVSGGDSALGAPKASGLGLVLGWGLQVPSGLGASGVGLEATRLRVWALLASSGWGP